MFSSFSWPDYFLFSGIVLVVYAIIICMLYYKTEMRVLLFRRKDLLTEVIDAPVKEIADPMQMVHELVSELCLLIRHAAEDKTILPELYFSLRQVIKNYLLLAPTAFKGKINQYIKEELEIRRLPDFSIEEYEALWK